MIHAWSDGDARPVIVGNVFTDHDGQTIDGREVHGRIYVRHYDVVIRDTVIVPSD